MGDVAGYTLLRLHPIGPQVQQRQVQQRRALQHPGAEQRSREPHGAPAYLREGP